ncbi:MAG: AIR synthase-related protein [Candidatus Moduliflexus flocculans]|nr:AIR synthase-related protein [Candidatus Moduliflexus flocculans]
MRDVTRGGLATVLFELAERLPYPLLIEEDRIPLSRPVRAAGELLGIDPLYMACEGKAVVVAPAKRADEFVRLMRRHPLGRKAAVIGEVQDGVGRPGELLLRTARRRPAPPRAPDLGAPPPHLLKRKGPGLRLRWDQVFASARQFVTVSEDLVPS